MKILYVTTIGSTMNFFKSFIKQLVDDCNIVNIATNEQSSPVPECYREWGCTVYPLNTTRNPLDKGNASAIKQLEVLVNESHYDIVHCHTPIAAACVRLACRKARKHGTKVIYTAHGFHFYKGAPLKNWLLYYPVEKLCARYTDTLITINKEDYELAKRKLHVKRIEYVPGVGIDVNKFKNTQVDKNAKRQEFGVPESAFLIASVGELNKTKNHEIVIRAIAGLKNQNIHYAIAGRGELHEYLQNLAKELGVEKQVHLLGFRNDVAELYKAADVCAFPSIREGLPVAVMEAMACGLPCVVSNIRGNVDLIDMEKGGYTCSPINVLDFANAINALYSDCEMRDVFGKYVGDMIVRYDFKMINREMERIYGEYGKN